MATRERGWPIRLQLEHGQAKVPRFCNLNKDEYRVRPKVDKYGEREKRWIMQFTGVQVIAGGKRRDEKKR